MPTADLDRIPLFGLPAGGGAQTAGEAAAAFPPARPVKCSSGRKPRMTSSTSCWKDRWKWSKLLAVRRSAGWACVNPATCWGNEPVQPGGLPYRECAGCLVVAAVAVPHAELEPYCAASRSWRMRSSGQLSQRLEESENLTILDLKEKIQLLKQAYDKLKSRPGTDHRKRTTRERTRNLRPDPASCCPRCYPPSRAISLAP